MPALKGLSPRKSTTPSLEAFIAEVRNGTLHRKPNDLHRKVALIWNEVVQRSEFGLQPVTVPSFRSPAKRIDWTLLPRRVPQGTSTIISLGAPGDPLAADARSRALAPRTIKLRQDQIHAAMTALVESGVEPTAIKVAC